MSFLRNMTIRKVLLMVLTLFLLLWGGVAWFTLSALRTHPKRNCQLISNGNF